MHEYWFEYVKSCYDLVVESEGNTGMILQHEVEAYVVHLMARNFNRTDIGNDPLGMKLLEAINSGKSSRVVSVADECLLVHSFPLRKTKWATETYYQELGITAYGMVGHIMERNFTMAANVMSAIFNKKHLNLKMH